MRRAWEEVTGRDPKLLPDVIRRGLEGERLAKNALGYVELGAKLHHEIGQGSDADMPVRKIIIHTNVNLYALRRAAVRAAIDVTPTAVTEEHSPPAAARPASPRRTP